MWKKRHFILISVPLLIFSIPLIATNFSRDVNWTLSDFVLAAVLLFGTALMIEITLRHASNLILRITIITVLLLLLFSIWVELAVGVFGTPFAGS